MKRTKKLQVIETTIPLVSLERTIEELEAIFGVKRDEIEIVINWRVPLMKENKSKLARYFDREDVLAMASYVTTEPGGRIFKGLETT